MSTAVPTTPGALSPVVEASPHGTQISSERTGSTATSLTPSITILTSLSTAPALGPGQSASVITVTSLSTIVAAPPSSTPAPDAGGRLQPSTKIALGAGIASGVVLILLLAIGGFVLGRRTSRSKTSEQRGWWGRWTRWRRGEQIVTGDRGFLEADVVERHELPGEGRRHEMETKANVREMEEVRAPVELPGCSSVRQDWETSA